MVHLAPQTTPMGLCSLDIVSGSGMGSRNGGEKVVLRQNKTILLSRALPEYIIASRNEILENKGYNLPEDWDFSWSKHLGPIWSPKDLPAAQKANLETWHLPEYFKEDILSASDPKITQATNRTDDDVRKHFEAHPSTVLANMSALIRHPAHRNLRSWECGNNNYLRMTGTGGGNIWNVSTGDFCYAAFFIPNDSALRQEAVCGVKSDDHHAIKVDLSGGRTQSIISVNNSDYTVNATGDGVPTIVVGGRKGGYPFIWSNGLSLTHGSQDLADLDVGNRPDWGDIQATPTLNGSQFEIIFINDNADDTTENIVTDDLVEKLSGYLAWKYNVVDKLEADHPYKIEPPRGPITI
jgi:hypothetical protein